MNAMITRCLGLLICSLFLFVGCISKGHVYIESPYKDLSTLKKGEIVHIETGRLFTEEELLDYVSLYPVVYVGELHDSVEAHRIQLSIIKGLNERFPGQVAIGLEMLQQTAQQGADAFIKTQMEEKDFFKLWSKNWQGNYRYYREIIRYARDNSIPLVALNADSKSLKAIRRNSKDVTESGPDDKFPDMDFDDTYYNAHLDAVFQGHAYGANHVGMFKKIQVLWDETMAQNGAKYLASPEGKGKHFVILAGENHVQFGFGIPRRLFRREPAPYVVVAPLHVEIADEKKEKSMDIKLHVIPLKPVDFFWAVRYEGLEDKIVMLGVSINNVAGGGVKVLGLIPSSPAAKGGIVKGDIIVSLDGITINGTSDLIFQVSLRKPKDQGNIEVIRNGEKKMLEIVFDVIKQHY